MYHIIVIILFFLLFFSCFASERVGSYTAGISSYILILIFCGFVKYTPDWDGYVYWYENDSGRDIFFNEISRLFLQLNLDYSYLHLTFVALHGLFLVYLTQRIIGKYSGIALFIYISVVYLFYTTQLRFILAYFLACLGFFIGLYEKKLLKALVLYGFAVMSHVSIIAIAPIFFLVSFAKKSPRGLVLKTGAGAALLYILMVFIVPHLGNDSYLVDYFSSGATTSKAFGGISTFAPYFLSSIFIFKLFPKMPPPGKISISHEAAKWSSQMAIASMIYFPLSIYYQISGHRFIVLGLIFHIIAWVYISISRSLFPFNRFLILAFVWLWFVFFTYTGPAIFGFNSYTNKTFQTLESNELF